MSFLSARTAANPNKYGDPLDRAGSGLIARRKWIRFSWGAETYLSAVSCKGRRILLRMWVCVFVVSIMQWESGNRFKRLRWILHLAGGASTASDIIDCTVSQSLFYKFSSSSCTSNTTVEVLNATNANRRYQFVSRLREMEAWESSAISISNSWTGWLQIELMAMKSAMRKFSNRLDISGSILQMLWVDWLLSTLS